MTEVRIDIQDKTFPAAGDARPHQAIAGLDFILHSNEFVCLVGPSGCGKTTLLNIIAGLDRDFRGKITLDKQGGAPRIGYVFQNPRLLPWRTVRENIALALPEGIPDSTIDSLLAAMNLSDMQHVYPERLSLGMSRRVAIIRAFAVDPDILLLDEPFVSLDPPTARQVRSLLLRLWEQRPHSILFVTHDLREAITLADRLIFLNAPPMHVLSEIPVDIPRADRDDEAAVEAFRQQLIANHPKIKTLL